MAENPTFQIPKEVIEPIIQAHVTTAVASALGGQSRLIEQAITAVMTQKVDSNGNRSNYNSDVQWLQWAMQEAVKKAVRAALESELAKQEELIRAHITSELKKSKSPLVKQLVEGMTKGVLNATANSWRLKVSYGDD